MAARRGGGGGRSRGGDYHVGKDKDTGDWRLERTKSERASGLFDTQREAAARGRELAEKAKVDLVIKGEDGKIRSKDSYGNESPKRDKEH